MAVTFDLDSVKGVAVGVARGPLTLKEIKESAVSMWRQVEGPDIRVLWDLRDARFDFSVGEVKDLAEFIKQHSPPGDLRTAFVVSTDLEFGLVRMFEVFREVADAQTATFRGIGRALEWLAGDATFHEDGPVKPSSS